MKPLTAIALSGGIDSLVAAYLLKKQGHNIIGIHFITGYETQNNESNKEVKTAPHNEKVQWHTDIIYQNASSDY